MATEPLQADVYVAPVIPAATGDSDPNKRLWSPISCTLIQGPTSAVIVDTPINIQQTTDLADWIAKTAPRKKLTHLFITHVHGDHFFGAPVLQKRFPGIQIVSTAKVAGGIKEQYGDAYTTLWSVLFPNGQLPEEKPLASSLPASNEFTLDGYKLHAIDVPHSDCEHSSVLHVPSLDLVVGGDVIYGDCYQFLGQANTHEKRQQWIDALTMIEELNPKIVVAGHKRASQIDGPYLLQATKKYIQVFERECERLKGEGQEGEEGATALEKRMKELYPQRWNEWILKQSCLSAFA